MFDWEKCLRELSNYNVAFEIKQGYYHISLIYKEGWCVLTPENEYIHAEERNGIYHYIAQSDSVNLNELFKTINDTIDYNKDLEKKLALFKEKTEELQAIFANEDYDTLKTIEFSFAKKTPKPKKDAKKAKAKTTRVKKNAKETKKTEKDEITPIEPTVETEIPQEAIAEENKVS